MIAHIAKRIAFVVIGYLVGLVASAAAFPGILFLISLLKMGLWPWLQGSLLRVNASLGGLPKA